MKKLILFVVCCFIGCINVSALENDSEVTYQYIDNIYSNRQIDGNFYTGPQGIVYVNGKLAYCLDASLILNQNLYSSSNDFSIHNIDENTLNYLELISYFGYGYENRTDYKYYLAAQEIIWELLNGGEIYWTNGKGGEVINIDAYKNDIITSIEQYKLSPDIPTYLETYINEDIILEDKNNILQYYEVSELGNIIDNKLILNAKTKGIQKVTLTKKPLSNNVSYIYYCDGSQTLATFGYSSKTKEVIELEYQVKNKVKLTLVKKDKETDKTIKSRKTQIKLFDVIRDRYITENGSDILTIGEKGELELNTYLEEGEYIVEEVSAPIGYKKLENGYNFYIDENDSQEKTIAICNEPMRYSIVINKNIETFSGIYRPQIGIEGVYNFEKGNDITYGLYASEDILDEEGNIKYDKDSLITEIVINNGIGSYSEIPYGRYYLKELTCPKDYELDLSITELSLIDEVYEKEFYFQNKLKKGNLTIRKTNNNIGLSGAVFKLYGDKYLTTITVTSDESGYIILKEMPYDLYHLKEIEAPNGYKIDTEEKQILLETDTYYYEFENEKEQEEIIPDASPEQPESPPGTNDEDIVEPEGEEKPSTDGIEKPSIPEDTLPNPEEPTTPQLPIEPVIPEVPEEVIPKPNEPAVPDVPEETIPEKPVEPIIPDEEQVKPQPENPKEEITNKPNEEFNNTNIPESTEDIEIKVENPDTYIGSYEYGILSILLYICVLLRLKNTSKM